MEQISELLSPSASSLWEAEKGIEFEEEEEEEDKEDTFAE